MAGINNFRNKMQALAMFLILSDQAIEADLEIELDVIYADDGGKKLLGKLNGLRPEVYVRKALAKLLIRHMILLKNFNRDKL